MTRLPTLALATVAVIALGLITACDDTGAAPGRITVSGHAFQFFTGHPPLPGARIHILEQPERSVLTDDAGAFRFEDLEEGAEATFVLTADDYYHETQTKTFTLGAVDIERVTLQVPDDYLVWPMLANKLGTTADATRCQIASTVTAVGLSMYDQVAHGEPGAVVTIDPPLPAEHGPFYFDAATIPDSTLTETSEDGGVIYVNVPPGRYTLRAEKPGVEFLDAVVGCRPDVLTNASPPHGLQALE